LNLILPLSPVGLREVGPGVLFTNALRPLLGLNGNVLVRAAAGSSPPVANKGGGGSRGRSEPEATGVG